MGGVLERQASPDEDLSEAEGFVIERLKVPEKWVFRAKVGNICCEHHLPCNKNTSTHTLSIPIVTTSRGHLLLSPFHCDLPFCYHPPIFTISTPLSLPSLIFTLITTLSSTSPSLSHHHYPPIYLTITTSPSLPHHHYPHLPHHHYLTITTLPSSPGPEGTL